MTDLEPQNTALHRQRRFLMLMSLAVIGYWLLGINPKEEVGFGGFLFTIEHRHRVEYVLWAVWAWALLRYFQRIYELLTPIWNEVIEDVDAEDQRIAFRHARKQIVKMIAASDEAKEKEYHLGNILFAPGEPHRYRKQEDKGRSYSLTIRLIPKEHTLGLQEKQSDPVLITFTPMQARWLRFRAWIHAVLRLPAFSEYVAPLLLAALALGVIVWHRWAWPTL